MFNMGSYGRKKGTFAMPVGKSDKNNFTFLLSIQIEINLNLSECHVRLFCGPNTIPSLPSLLFIFKYYRLGVTM